MSDMKQSDNADHPEKWVDEHGDVLYRYALRHVSEIDAAQELVQETLLSALKGRQTFQGNSTIRTWLISILRHKIIDRFRAQGREPQRAANTADTTTSDSESSDIFERIPTSLDDWQLDPSNHLQQKQFLTTLQNCLEKLPEKLRSIFIMREVEGHNRTEICNDFGISTTHVGVLLHRAREQLRSCLGKNWER